MSYSHTRDLTEAEREFVQTAKAIDGLTRLTVLIQTSDGESFEAHQADVDFTVKDLQLPLADFLPRYGVPAIATCLQAFDRSKS